MKHYCVFETEKGFVGLVSRDGKLHSATLPKPTRGEALQPVNAGLDGVCVEDVDAFGDLPDRFRRYFEGEPVEFADVKLDLDGYPPFYSAVILAAQRIPYGTLVTYGELARTAGREKAARAAGSAMANNPVPIVVPCHRVVAASGKLGGFSGGLDWKRELLRIEAVRETH